MLLGFAVIKTAFIFTAVLLSIRMSSLGDLNSTLQQRPTSQACALTSTNFRPAPGPGNVGCGQSLSHCIGLAYGAHGLLSQCQTILSHRILALLRDCPRWCKKPSLKRARNGTESTGRQRGSSLDIYTCCIALYLNTPILDALV